MTFFLNPYRRWLLYSTKTKVIYKSNRSARKLMAQFSLSSWSPQQEPHSFMTVMRLWYRVVECSVWAKRFKHLAKTMLSVWHFISQSGTTTFRLPGQAVGRTQCSKIRKKKLNCESCTPYSTASESNQNMLFLAINTHFYGTFFSYFRPAVEAAVCWV